MKKQYDVIIVGAGPAGIFTAYELTIKNPTLDILLVDKGLNIYDRKCPILEKKITKCPVNKSGVSGCYPACSITSGFGGAGAYSDGKFNITSEFGGWMSDYLNNDEVESLIKYVDSINLEYGATPNKTNPNTKEVLDIEKAGIAHGLKLLRSEVRHLGTEQNLEILKNIYEYLKNHVDMFYSTLVENLSIEDNTINGVYIKSELISAKHVVIGPGRDGSKWLINLCKEHKLGVSNNQVDIGVRVETNDIIMAEINKHLYEGKFVYRTSVGTTVRTFCSNPSGHVVVENHSGTMLANGHAYKDENLGSKNTNFALLVSHEFEEPFNRPNEYANDISSLANKLSNGSIIVQKYGDIKAGRRTTAKRLAEGFVSPTLKEAVPGDLGLVLPYNTMKSLIEMIEALDYITPGIATEHTLFYGVESKFYSARPKITTEFETEITNLFVIGDGAGITRGLAQAGASGVWVARNIVKELEVVQMSNVAVIVGTQWGDEGKGKITDFLAARADVVVRYQGGNNAGHTIVFNGNKYALHLIPSGIFDKDTVNVLTNGMVINFEALINELNYLKENNFNDYNLLISDRAHVVLPYHIDLDKYYETVKGDDKVGTTNKGIGPAYTDKTSRQGIRVSDLFDEELLRSKLEFNLKLKNPILKECGANYTVDGLMEYLKQYSSLIEKYVCDTSIYLNNALESNKRVLFEGAQGIMLCIDHGTYPYVTSSSPTASSIPLNAGIAAKYIDNVVGISKAYSTRVGEGAFPTEFDTEISRNIRVVANEYGTTTGRPRRIGWFDSVVVRHSVRVGSVTTLSIMLLDVLTGVDELKICTGYLLDGEEIDYVPASIREFDKCQPIYITTPGWVEDITSVTSFDELPLNAQKYLKLIEEYCNVSISIFSVGPDRLQTIVMKDVL